jgi:hypothetical protein
VAKSVTSFKSNDGRNQYGYFLCHILLEKGAEKL